MASDPVEQPETTTPDPRLILGMKPRTLGLVVAGLLLVVVIDVFAFILVPPFQPGEPEETCAVFSTCMIEGTLHFPAPKVLWSAGSGSGDGLFDISLTDTLLTMLIVTALVLVLVLVASRGKADVPRGLQNFTEWAYESMSAWGRGMGGSRAAPYIPMFAAFFVLILAFNWSGLVPPVGLIDGLRAPTSDLNVTIGLALVAFGFFQLQGVRRLGARGYASKFFPIGEFRKGIGVGLIAIFVGLIELILEFIKPVTLSVRLFGNIYGGEVALAVITSLAVILIPVAIYGLEIILTFVQALIFSSLALVFTLIAVESHDHDEDHHAETAPGAVHPSTQPASAGN